MGRSPSTLTEMRHLGAHNPQGLTLGVVGPGKIGYRIAQKAYRALDMKVVYVVVAKSKEQEDAIGGARGCETIEEMLAVAHCIVLAMPGQAGQLLDREIWLSSYCGRYRGQPCPPEQGGLDAVDLV